MPVYKPTPVEGLPSWMQQGQAKPGVGDLDLMGPLAVPAMAAEGAGGLFGKLMSLFKGEAPQAAKPLGAPTSSMGMDLGETLIPSPKGAASAIQDPWKAKPLTLPSMAGTMTKDELKAAIQKNPGMAELPEMQSMLKNYNMKVGAKAPNAPGISAEIRKMAAPPSTSGGALPAEAAQAVKPESAPIKTVTSQELKAAAGKRSNRGSSTGSAKITEDTVREIRRWLVSDEASKIPTKMQRANTIADRWGLSKGTADGIVRGDSFAHIKP